MTSGTFRNALQRTYAEQSFFGLQVIDYNLRQQFIETIEEGVRIYRMLSIVTEMADQLRDDLKQNWRSISPCRDTRERCIMQRCSCSYADYLRYRSLRTTQARLERQYTHMAREAYEIKATWNYVLRPVAARLVSDDRYRRLFLATLQVCGEITAAEYDIAEMEGYLSVRFLPESLELHIGHDPVTVRWIETVHEPYDNPRR